MEKSQRDELVAVVTRNKEAVGGDVPIFFANSENELDRIAILLSKVLMAAIHEISDGVYILVKH